MNRTSPGRRRGSILVLALLVVTIGALVGMTVIYYAAADRRAAEMGVRTVQARAMAWSGVQIIMSELASQREQMLSGETPRVTDNWVAPAEESSRQGVRWGFRVKMVGAHPLESEAGKLDVNTVPEGVLAKVPGLSADIAKAIVQRRGSRRFTSVAELVTIPGITHDALFGTPDAPSDPSEPGLADPDALLSESPAPLSLSRLLTVFNFDPQVQVGVGPRAGDSAGKQCININVPWSDELGRAIEDRFDKGTADGVKGLMARGDTFKNRSDIVKKLRQFRIEPKDWLEVLDAFTTSADEYRVGTVDLQTAPAAVLECIPGISPEAAAEIVARRERLDPTRRATVAWPVLENIMKEDEFEQAVDMLSTRSLQWRVVIEAGVFSNDEEGNTAEHAPWGSPAAAAASGASGSLPADEAAPLRDHVILEAVIDVASLRPRVAYLREATYLPTARLLATLDSGRKAEEWGGAGDQSTNQTPDSGELGDVGSSPHAFRTELDPGAFDIDRPSTEDVSHDLGHNRLDGSEGSPSDDPDSGDPSAERADTPAGPPAPVDRRLGRWTTGSGGARP